MKKTLMAFAALAVGVLALAAPSAAAADDSNPSIAHFEGRKIDLRDGWEQAKACTSDGEVTNCFRSERAMDQFLQGASTQEASTMASCATSVRLYNSVNYGGTVLNLYSQSVWLNLSSYGFSDMAESFRIGACAAYLADGTNGSGSWFPGSTAAGTSNPDMGSTWRNRVSSVYIT